MFADNGPTIISTKAKDAFDVYRRTCVKAAGDLQTASAHFTIPEQMEVALQMVDYLYGQSQAVEPTRERLYIAGFMSRGMFR